MLVRELKGHTKQVCALAFSPDGTRLVSGSHPDTVRLWNLATGVVVWQIAAPRHDGGIAFTPDGTRTVTALRSGELSFID